MSVVSTTDGIRTGHRRLGLARGPILTATAAVITLTALAIAVAGGIADPTTLIGSGATVFYVVPGLILLARRDWHIIGWLLLLIGLAFSITYSGAAVYTAGYVQLGDPAWFAWVVDNWAYAVAFACLVALVTVFPEGLQGRSARQKAIGRATLSVSATMVVVAMLIDEVGGETVPELLPNPTGLGVFPQWIGNVVVSVGALMIASSVLGFWLRYRRTTGSERARYRWVGYSFALVMVALLVGVALTAWLGSDSIVPWLLVIAAFYLVPVAFSLGILRLGLYEIDRIVSRTVSYTLVALVVGAVYALPVILLPRLLGESNHLIVAASTLVAAGVFNPVRRRIQRAVDRRFNRARFDAEMELATLTTRLRSALSVDTISGDLAGIATRTVQPGLISLWISDRG